MFPIKNDLGVTLPARRATSPHEGRLFVRKSEPARDPPLQGMFFRAGTRPAPTGVDFFGRVQDPPLQGLVISCIFLFRIFGSRLP